MGAGGRMAVPPPKKSEGDVPHRSPHSKPPFTLSQIKKAIRPTICPSVIFHTHRALPHYDSTEWDWLRAALATVDRDCGILHKVFHHIIGTHVAHHLLSTMPFFHVIEATKAIKPVLGDYYQFDGTPFYMAVWMEAKECIYVEAKEFIGQTSFDDQLYYLKRNNGTKHFKTAHRDTLFRKSFAGLEAERIEEEGEEEDFYEEESMAAASEEIFHGFLTIGTLGSESVIGDPATPSFAYSVENITEKDTEITENELKLINEELEKVLGSDAKEEWCTDSSGRNSHVSTGRSSYGSTITLSGKSIEGQEAVCPLKGYLLNSATELPETTVAKKEHRTSLGDLFQKTKMTEDDFGKHGKEERQNEKAPDKSAMHLLKKKLMKKVLHASSKGSTTASGGSPESSSAETRMHKILHMFHKKVHPENSAATKDPHEQQKDDSNQKTSNGSDNNGNHLFPDEDIMIIPHRNITKEKSRSLKGQTKPLQFRFAGNESNGNRECWIKTDADYLVLEL